MDSTPPTQDPAALELREIFGPDHAECCYWLNMLQRQFPLNEQVFAGSVLRQWQAKSRGEAQNSHFYTAHLLHSGDAVGMAWYDYCPEASGSVLWYIAVSPGAEGHGYGSDILRKLLIETYTTDAARMVFLEVETSGHGGASNPTGEERRLRQIDQRNRFYVHRHGAQQLTGISYTQKVGDQAAIPMDLLVFFNSALPLPPAEETYNYAKAIFGESLQPNGPIGLSSDLPSTETRSPQA